MIKSDHTMKKVSTNKYGLSERDISTIQGILVKYPEVSNVLIFGSRATGSSKPGSDIDLAVVNDGIDDKIVLRIRNEFEESSLPYRVDIVLYTGLIHQDLKDHINRVGIPFYKSGEVV